MADISLLRTFIEISKTRHFGKTAQALFVTQSAVSARMRQLEDTLGVKLLTRERNNIQLTPAGMKFLPYAENMINTWNRARQETALDEENKVLLSIGAVPSLWDTDLQQLSILARRHFPKVALQIEAHSPDSLLRLMIENSLDVAFMFEQPQLGGKVVEQLGALDLIMVSTTANMTATRATEQDDYIMVDWGSSFASTHARAFPSLRPPMLRISHGHLALGFLCQAGGSAYLPRSMVVDQLSSGVLHIVEDAPAISREYFVLYSDDSFHREQIDQILDLHRRHLATTYPDT